MSLQTATAPKPGFSNQAFDSNHIFRNVLEVLSRPGKIMPNQKQLEAPEGLNSSATTFLLALADMETPVWLSPDIKTEQAINHLKFHTGCSVTSSCTTATFAVADARSDLSFLNSLPIGTPEMPHQSATLILMVDDFEGSTDLTLSGPGIETTEYLAPNPLPEAFLPWAQSNGRLFPCGVDVIFAGANSIAALPRSTKIEV